MFRLDVLLGFRVIARKIQQLSFTGFHGES